MNSKIIIGESIREILLLNKRRDELLLRSVQKGKAVQRGCDQRACALYTLLKGKVSLKVESGRVNVEFGRVLKL